MTLLKKLPSFVLMVKAAQATLLRFPLVILSALLCAGSAIYGAENDFLFDHTRLTLTFSLGIPFFLTAALLKESRGWSGVRSDLIELAIGAGLMSTFYYCDHGGITNNSFLLRYIHLNLALHLAVSFVAFLPAGKESDFWQFNRYVFLRILLSMLYGLVLFLGLVLALFTIDKLFSLNIVGRRYSELWILSAVVFQTWFFLAGVPLLGELRGDQSYPRGLRIFVQYLLIPLVSLYMVILYCYMAKMLVTQIWPNGWIGWLVSVMAVVGVFNLLLIDPEKKRAETRWIQTYSKYYYILVLPLLVLLLVAIGKRVSEYGVTEERYFLMTLAILLIVLAAYFLASAKKDIRVIPIALCFVAIVTKWGPWGAYQVSLHNQAARAHAILERHEMLGAQAPVTPNISEAEAGTLTSIFNYITYEHAPDTWPTWLTDLTRKLPSGRTVTSELIMEGLGLHYTAPVPKTAKRFFLQSDFYDKPFPVAGFSQALPFSYTFFQDGKTYPFSYQGRNLVIRFEPIGQRVIITEKSKEVLAWPVTVLAQNILKDKGDDSKLNLPVKDMSLDGVPSGLEGRLVIQKISGKVKESDLEVEDINAWVLLK